LARILQSEYGSDRCSIVSQDYYRDKKIVAKKEETKSIKTLTKQVGKKLYVYQN